MHARDAAGRQVSLLNDDNIVSHASYCQDAMPHRLAYRTASHMSAASYHGSYGRSPSPFPNTPELLRSDSYDSQVSSNEPRSPLTPVYDYSNVRGYPAEARSPYEDYYPDPQQQQQFMMQQHPQGYPAKQPRPSYDEEPANSPPAVPGKRYPCRYRESHGCEKTFTTSGHASRHSKIHTAEKAVQCTFAGCSKKFTRADNMKQHLETHYKDKSRSASSSSRPSLSERKSSSASTSGKLGRSHKHSTTAVPMIVATGPASLASSGMRGDSWDCRGLDALAMAVACQEDA